MPVVDPGEGQRLAQTRDEVLAGKRCFAGDGSRDQLGRSTTASPTAEFKAADHGRSGRATGWAAQAVNYKLRDWLFSRQRFWGEPFPILHELDDNGQPTGALRAVPVEQLPVDLPELDDFKPHGRPEPPLDKAPARLALRRRSTASDTSARRTRCRNGPGRAGTTCAFSTRNERALVDPDD